MGQKHIGLRYNGFTFHQAISVGDVNRWLIDEGIADSERMCILGQSFAGLLALMGTIDSRSSYSCGIDIAGVVDLNLFINQMRSFIGGRCSRLDSAAAVRS